MKHRAGLIQAAITLFFLALTFSATAEDNGRPSGDDLRRQFRQAYEAGEYKDAIKYGKLLVKQFPTDAGAYYNLACACALDKKTLAASKALKKAAKNGFADYELATHDPDLAGVRTDPVYIEAIKLIRKNQVSGRAEFEKKAARSKPLIFTPPGYGKTTGAPLIVALHGYGSTAEDIMGAWKETATLFGAVVVAPRAVRTAPNTNGFSWGTIAEADQLVMRAIDQVLDQHRIDKQRIVLSGFSQGGAMTYELGLRHADRFSGLIPIVGRYDQSLHAASHAKPNKMPKVYIMVGAEDYTVESNQHAAQDMKAAGMSVKLNIYEGVGHSLPDNHEEEFQKALQFFWPN